MSVRRATKEQAGGNRGRPKPWGAALSHTEEFGVAGGESRQTPAWAAPFETSPEAEERARESEERIAREAEEKAAHFFCK